MKSYDIAEWGKPLQGVMRETLQPGPQEVLLRLRYCGVCHTDVHIQQGFFDMGGGVKNDFSQHMSLPRTLGHEPVGVVVAIGAQVTGVRVGQTYLVNPWIGCGQCAQCADGQDNLCEATASIGIARPGGFSTHLMVPHSRYLVDLQGIEASQAAVLACSGVTAYAAATKLAPARAGHWVAVLGCGGLGLMGIAILRSLGHRDIIACDIDDNKLAAARAAGAKQSLNLQRGGASQLLELAGGRLFSMIDFVGAPATAALAIPSLRKGGRFVSVGLFGGAADISLVALATRAVSFIGSVAGTTAQIRELVGMVACGQLQLPAVVVRPLAQAEQSLRDLEAGQVTGRIVLDAMSEA